MLRCSKTNTQRQSNGKAKNAFVTQTPQISLQVGCKERLRFCRYTAIGFCRRYRNVFLISSADGISWDDSKTIEPIAVRANEGPFNVRMHQASNRVALIVDETVASHQNPQ